MSGPYETEREAREAAAAATGGEYSIASNFALLSQAIEAAGLDLGTYDWLIVNWLARWERATCAVIAGLITRAHAGALTGDQAQTVTAALDDAIEGIRDRAAHCGECQASPADLCDGCADRLARAELYAELAVVLGGPR